MSKKMECILCSRHLGEIRDGTVSKHLNHICSECVNTTSEIIADSVLPDGHYREVKIRSSSARGSSPYSESFLRDFFDLRR